MGTCPKCGMTYNEEHYQKRGNCSECGFKFIIRKVSAPTDASSIQKINNEVRKAARAKATENATTKKFVSSNITANIAAIVNSPSPGDALKNIPANNSTTAPPRKIQTPAPESPPAAPLIRDAEAEVIQNNVLFDKEEENAPAPSLPLSNQPEPDEPVSRNSQPEESSNDYEDDPIFLTSEGGLHLEDEADDEYLDEDANVSSMESKREDAVSLKRPSGITTKGFISNLIQKRKESREEQFESDLPFHFNDDGYYNDNPPKIPPEPDRVSPLTLLKIAGFITAIFLIISFLVYYA